jgi:hypothetical protein
MARALFLHPFKYLDSLARPVQTNSSIAHGHVNAFYVHVLRKVTTEMIKLFIYCNDVTNTFPLIVLLFTATSPPGDRICPQLSSGVKHFL